MIRFSKYFLAIAMILLAVNACEDYNKHVVGPFDTGSIDVSTYISIGNSLAAGYQNGALYQEGEMYSFPNLLARQMGVKNFKQPMINPGIGSRIAIKQFTSDPSNPVVVTQQSLTGTPTVAEPYQNLGVPGAILADYLNADAQTGGIKARAQANPFYGIVLGSAELSKQVPSIQNVVAAQNPTFVTFWLGNNDALGYVTSGGVTPMNTVPVFTQLYGASINSILGINQTVKIVAANIPNVADIPFATTVGPIFKAQLEAASVPGIYYFKSQTNGGEQAAQLLTSSIGNPAQALILLTAQNYLPLIGHPTGKYWRDIAKQKGVPVSAIIQSYGGALDTTKPFIVDPRNPLPNSLILDGDEISKAQGTIEGFNSAMNTVVGSSDRVAMVDINGIFNTIVNNGSITEDGITLTPTLGSLFSFDGVHPTNRGYAVVTNEIIKVMNDSFGANIQRINIKSIPEGFPLAPGAN